MIWDTPLINLVSIWYHSEPSEVTYSTNKKLVKQWCIFWLDLPMYETNFLILFHCAYRTREWSPPLPSLFVWWIVDYNIVVLAELGRASIMRTTAQRTKIQKFIQKFKTWLLANNSYHTQCLTTERKLKRYLKYLKMIKIPLCKFLDKILNN